MTRKRDREGQAFVDQMMYMIVGPLIGYPGWEDELRNHKTEITVQRMVHHEEVFRDQVCTEFEAMLYLSTASLAQPISHDWGQVYFWLFSRWKPEIAKAQDLLPDRPELNVNQKDDLVGLRRWMFKQQMAHLRAKGRVARAVAAQEPKEPPEVVQLSYFDEPGGGQ